MNVVRAVTLLDKMVMELILRLLDSEHGKKRERQKWLKWRWTIWCTIFNTKNFDIIRINIRPNRSTHIQKIQSFIAPIQRYIPFLQHVFPSKLKQQQFGFIELQFIETSLILIAWFAFICSPNRFDYITAILFKVQVFFLSIDSGHCNHLSIVNEIGLSIYKKKHFNHFNHPKFTNSKINS